VALQMPIHAPHIRLTREQLAALERCAAGISLRFDPPSVVNALLNAGYLQRNVAGVLTVTNAGVQYLTRQGASVVTNADDR